VQDRCREVEPELVHLDTSLVRCHFPL
jgi:hypothetical protein